MVENIQLSKRLKAIATYLDKTTLFADIGSDHAYLPCYVCTKYPNVRAIAGEVSKGPLARAKETVQAYQLADRIDVRLGNGLEVIDQNDHIDTITIAGMGGSLIANILTEGKDKLTNVRRLITQPNNNGYAVRSFLARNHYFITDELIIEENDHIYEIIVSEYSADDLFTALTEEEEKNWLFGPKLMKEKSTVFIKKWQAEHDKIDYIIKQMKQAQVQDEDKIAKWQTQQQWIKEVLS